MNNKPTIEKLWEIAEKYKPTGKPIMTGIKDFDSDMDGGIRGGELITISGISGHGKTLYALWITKQLHDSGVPTLWFTYEMNPWYLKEKFIQMGCKEDLNTYVPIEHSNNTDKWIEERILEGYMKYAIKVIFIDHLHYLLPPEQEMNISLLIGGVVRKLKQLAVKQDVTIYLIAHMRKLQIGEKVDVNAVRDSALIINESDYVYLIERLKKKKKALDDEPGIEMQNISRITLAKNRRTGNIRYKLFEVKNLNFWEVNSQNYKNYEN